MCQTTVISDKIVKLGTRSFKQRLELASGTRFTASKLITLNRGLDKLYDFLYSNFNTVTENDYNTFGPQLDILLQTLKELYSTCERTPDSWGLLEETDKLVRNYSALYEINKDFMNFRIENHTDKEMNSILSSASVALNALKV
jgi:hypothetical protein